MTAYTLIEGSRLDAPGLGAYREAVVPLTQAHGGVYVGRGEPGTAEVLEGGPFTADAVVLVRWPSMAAARGFWDSPRYRDEVKPLRDGLGHYTVTALPAHGEVDTAGAWMIIEGWDMPPGAMAPYGKAVSALVAESGAAYAVHAKADQRDVLEGAPDWQSLVISAWPSMAAARDFWASPRYQHDVKPLRAGIGRFQVTLIPAM